MAIVLSIICKMETTLKTSFWIERKNSYTSNLIANLSFVSEDDCPSCNHGSINGVVCPVCTKNYQVLKELQKITSELQSTSDRVIMGALIDEFSDNFKSYKTCAFCPGHMSCSTCCVNYIYLIYCRETIKALDNDLMTSYSDVFPGAS